MITRRRAIAIVAAMAIVAGAAIAIVGASQRGPDYHRDVMPIFARHCLECHSANGVAANLPFEGRPSPRMSPIVIRESVTSRSMPPWVADNTGLCGTWHGARWLDSAEVATIVAWVDHGARGMGGPADRLAPFSNASRNPGFRSDAAIDLGGVYAPGLGEGGYRCFIAEPKLEVDRRLAALRVTSSDPRGVAQLNLFALDSPEAERVVGALAASEKDLGYPCYGDTRGPDARLVASWTAGSPVLRIADDVGVALHAGRKLVIQMRYDIEPAGVGYRSWTRVELEFSDRARAGRVVRIEAAPLLAPGQRSTKIVARHPIDWRGEVVAITPWMHQRGIAMQLIVDRPGQPRVCLGTFDHWQTRNQQTVVATDRFKLLPDDALELACTYQTLAATSPIRGGTGIDDEECVATLLVAD